jgi:hypothetical protein
MAQTQAQPSAMGPQLERLVACEDIRSLRARYFRFVDAKRWADLAALFAADAVFDRGFGGAYRHPFSGEWSAGAAPQPELIAGREAIVAMIRAATEPLWTIHRGSDADITVTGRDEADAIWAMTDELRSAAGQLIMRGWGHYEESYRRVGGRWLIARTKLTRQYLEHGEPA